MLSKNELSFIFLWVLNPLLILFYQNCSSPNYRVDREDAAPVFEAKSQRTPACQLLSAPRPCAQ